MNYHEISPFKLLKPYGESDGDRFFGRARETRQLADALLKTKFILLYGASGTGKTSLIQCGLQGKFSPRDWLPIFVRRGNKSFPEAIREALLEQYQDFYSIRYPEAVLPPTEHLSLRELVKALFDLAYLPVYLILDQFEEIFTVGDVSEQDNFFQALGDLKLFNEDLFCKMLIVVREEYIAHFYRYEHAYPFLFEHRFRVEKMRAEQLEQAVYGTLTASYKESGYSDFHVDEGVPAQIVHNISDIHHEVDLTTLQVYLDRLYREDLKRIRAQGGEPRSFHFDLDLVGKNEIKNVLSDFLDQQLTWVNQRLQTPHAAELKQVGNIPLEVLLTLVTEQRTRRNDYAEKIHQKINEKKHLSASLPLVQDCLNALASQECRILTELRFAKTDEPYYELVHDRLAEQVALKASPEEQRYHEAISTLNNKWSLHNAARRKKEYLSLGELELIGQSVNLERLEEKWLWGFYLASEQYHKKLRRRQNWVTLGAVAAAVVFALMALFAFRQKQKIQINETYYRGLVRAQTDPTNGLKIILEALRINPLDTTIRASAYDIYTKNLLYNLVEIEKDTIDAIDFSANGDLIAFAAGNVLKLYQTNKAVLIDSTILTANYANCLIFKGSDTLYVAGSNQSLYLYKILKYKKTSLQLIDSILTENAISDICFARNSYFFCTISENSEDAIVWDIATRNPIKKINHENNVISAIAISPDGHWITVGTNDGQLFLNAISDNWKTVINNSCESAVTTIDISPDGRTIIAGFEDGIIRRWINVQSPDTVVQTEDLAFQDNSAFVFFDSANFSKDAIHRLIFSEGSSLYLVITKGKAEVFYAKTSQTGFKLIAGEEKSPYLTAKFKENQNAIYTVDIDGAIRRWNFANPLPIMINTNISGIAHLWITPDRKSLVVANLRGNSPFFEVYQTDTYKRIGLPTTFSNEIKQLFTKDGWLDIPTMLQFNEAVLNVQNSPKKTGILEWIDEGSSYIYLKDIEANLELRTQDGFLKQVFPYDVGCCIENVCYNEAKGHLAAVTNTGYILIWPVRPDLIREEMLK